MRWMVAWVGFCMAVCAWALPPIPELLPREEALKLAAERSREDAPDAHSLTLMQSQVCAYAPDGSEVLWAEFWAKALTETGAKKLRDVEVWYREGFSEAEFQLAEVVRADGSVELIDLKSNVASATADGGDAENIYDPKAKLETLTVPQLGAGDTLHVIFARQVSRPRIPDTFSSLVLFEFSDEPLLYSALTILAPKELPLKSMAVLDEVPGTMAESRETLADGRIRYRWVARNVPQVFAEEKMPDELTQLQRVVLSTFGTWEELSKWYWGLCEPHLATTPEIDAKVQELIAGKATDREKAEALFGFVAQGIRYMGIIAEDTAPGYEPHDVALTFENRYGVCRDKGALLVAMLRKAGLNAFPVLINAGSKRDIEVPIPYFNHAVVAIDEGNNNYYLVDPTDDTARAELPAYLSDCTYLVCRPEGDGLRTTPVPSPEEHVASFTTEGRLEASGALELTSVIRFKGINDNVYRPIFVRGTPEKTRERFDGLLKRVVPGAELVELTVSPEDPSDISQPLEVRITASVPNYAVTDREGRTSVDLPFLSRAIGVVNYLFDGLGQPTRKFDWEIDFPCAVREQLTLRGFGRLGKPELLPDDPVLSTNGATYDVTCKRTEQGDLELSRALALTKKSYSPEDYRNLRRFHERLARFETLRPLFAQAPEQDSDAVILRDSLATTLDAEGQTVRRFAQDVRILTFQGKRALGEVKLWHNPAWQTLTLNTAETLTAQGDRVPVTPKEISELDADDAALAPRYPALRKTVISLPAIEVGSTSTMDWQIASNDSRPFSEVVSFGGRYPVEEQSYTLTLPLARVDDLRVAERHFDNVAVERTVSTNDLQVTYGWRVRNLPATPTEANTPPATLWRPTITLAMRDATVSRAYETFFQQIETLVEDGSEAVEALAEELTDGLETEDARLRAIQAFMAQRIRYLGTTWEDLPFGTFSAPDTTLAEGYGNRMDRLILWLALLRAADVEAQLVFANDLSVQTYYQCREALALREVPRWDRWTLTYLLLPDGRLVGDEGEFDEPGSTLSPSRAVWTAEGIQLYQQPEDLRSRAEQTLRVVVKADGDAVLTSETAHWGTSAGGVRRASADLTPETRRRTIAASANAMATGAEPISRYQMNTKTYPVTTRLAVEAKHYATRQGNLLSIPVNQLLRPLYGLRGAQRKNPIWQSERAEQVSTYDLWLPAGSEILSKPEPFKLLLPGGGVCELTLESETLPHTGLVRLTYRTRVAMLPTLMDSWYFPALTELDRRLAAPQMRAVIVRLPE